MTSSTTKNQMETLVGFMEKNPDIASGYTKKSKEEVTSFWQTVERELNSIGPPIKSILEWKKVWTDKRKYIKNKISENLKMKQSTGGGPFREYKFAPLDQTIIKLCGMTQSVEGCSDSRKFGLPSCSKRQNENQDAKIENVLVSPPSKKYKTSETIPTAEELEFSPMSEGDDFGQINANTSESFSHIAKPISCPSKNATATKSTAEFLEKELQLHREICDKIGLAIEKYDKERANNQVQHNEIKISLQKICKSIDRLCDHQQKYFEEQKRNNLEMEQFRRCQLDEQKRNNIEMERFRKCKLETNIQYKQIGIENVEAQLRLLN
ncbi:uncharacterized protein LOC129906465 [Episyrphus balteatus]|uniref:uncharacterized protein LOC129906465 n=1 Tax=Episyrphus balteatus TaxID=286459 RepID=UPI002486170F|nr:uncharacterized protein LOC129906465 [Episyrphus balteatus]